MLSNCRALQHTRSTILRSEIKLWVFDLVCECLTSRQLGWHITALMSSFNQSTRLSNPSFIACSGQLSHTREGLNSTDRGSSLKLQELRIDVSNQQVPDCQQYEGFMEIVKFPRFTLLPRSPILGRDDLPVLPAFQRWSA